MSEEKLWDLKDPPPVSSPQPSSPVSPLSLTDVKDTLRIGSLESSKTGIIYVVWRKKKGSN